MTKMITHIPLVLGIWVIIITIYSLATLALCFRSFPYLRNQR